MGTGTHRLRLCLVAPWGRRRLKTWSVSRKFIHAPVPSILTKNYAGKKMSIVIILVLHSRSTITEITEYCNSFSFTRNTSLSFFLSWVLDTLLNHWTERPWIEILKWVNHLPRSLVFIIMDSFVKHIFSTTSLPAYNQIYSRNDMLFPCWNSQSFHLQTGGGFLVLHRPCHDQRFGVFKSCDLIQLIESARVFPASNQ